MESVNRNSSEAASVNLEEIVRLSDDEMTPGCFEFRLRTRSFDMHQLTRGNKLKKIGRLFRTTSDTEVKESSSVSSSPVGGASPHHARPRRFVRVVRDKREDCTEDGRFVVHRYSEAYLDQINRDRHDSETDYSDRPLPYEVTGHTILKRPALTHSVSINSSNSGDGESTPTTALKHASFRDEVVVIEIKQKCKVREPSAQHVVRLHDALLDDYDSHAACQRFEDFAADETIAAMTKDLLSSSDTDDGEPSPQPEPAAADACSSVSDAVVEDVVQDGTAQQ